MTAKSPTVRVGFALGSWQLVTLAAGMAQARGGAPVVDHVVLYETGPVAPGLAAAMRDVGSALWPGAPLVEAFDILAGVPGRPSAAAVAALSARLRERVGLAHIDELWLCWITRPAEKLILETWPTARVRLYEDGLTTYLPPARPPRREAWWQPAARRLAAGWPSAQAVLARREQALVFRRHRARPAPAHVARVNAAWLVLSDLWPAPAPFEHLPWRTVDPAHLRAALAACRHLPAMTGFTPSAAPRPTVLVLGQSLSRWGVLSRADEAALYAGVLAELLALGYDVWWKEHPRVQQPFFDELARAAPPGRVRQLDLPYALPVELVADRLGAAACVAGISAALCYLPRLHGLAGYTFADRMAPHMTGVWAVQNEMVRRAVAPLSALPPADTAFTYRAPEP